MSTAAVMLVKDEADVIEPVLRHLAWHVDQIIVADNLSTDGTSGILVALARELPLIVGHDREVGHFQSQKTTKLAMDAFALGHRWVVPCDADEVWYVAAEPERRVADFLDGQSPDVQVVAAELYHHLPTALDLPSFCDECSGTGIDPSSDPDDPANQLCVFCDGVGGEPNPFRRIGWRNRQRAGLPKVACRLRPDLVVHDGNHGASTTGTGLRVGGLVVRHFSWRSEEQYLSKIRNGARAFAATDLPPGTGAHWRMHGDPDDEGFDDRVREHFRTWFRSPDPASDEALIYDPVTPFLRNQ